MRTKKEWKEEWNELHCKYVAEQMTDCHGGITTCQLKDSPDFIEYKETWPREEMVGYRNRKMADYCEKTILEAKEAYYKGEQIMEDSVYDGLEESLKRLRPNSKILEKVG